MIDVIKLIAMYSREVVLLLCAIAGVAMVVGSIALLRAGAIKISEDNAKGDAASLELMSFLKLQTRYPALGLFVVALGFFAVALVSSRPAEPGSVRITGTISGPDSEDISVNIEPAYMKSELSSGGKIDATIRPRFESMHVEVVATGWEPSSITRFVNPDDMLEGVVDLEEFKFNKRVASKPDQGWTIEPLETESLPPVDQPTGEFGR